MDFTRPSEGHDAAVDYACWHNYIRAIVLKSKRLGALLHRYSHLGFFLSQVGVRDFPDSMAALGRALTGIV